MKTLYIVRHAKSSWEFNVPDDERPLLKKGIKRTNKIAAYLCESGIKPDMMISSHAIRALETAKIIATTLEYPIENIKVTSHLYHANTENIFDELYQLNDEVKTVMIFGHNPTFTSFANIFLTQKIDWLPTSGLVAINIEADSWTEISTSEHETAFAVFPRDL